MDNRVRNATATDLPRINEIYNSYIVDRYTSFDTEPWNAREREAWFRRYAVTGRYQVLVVESEGDVVAFAASSPFRPKAGYSTSVETTVVVDERYIGSGYGGRLLPSLLARLEVEDVHRAYALIALPNDASVALHDQLGYREVGTLDEVGFKLDTFRSVLIMELRL